MLSGGSRLNIIVTGTPGVGKTSFSKVLSEALGLEYIPLDDVLIENKLYLGFDEERGSYIIDIERARSFVYENIVFDGVVLDSHLAVAVVPCERVDVCLVLRCDPYILMDRLRSKGYPEKKVLENIQAEILDVVLTEALGNCGSEKVIQLDVSQGVEKRVAEVVERIRRGIHIESEPVDWLGLIMSRGDLERFFPEGIEWG